MSSERYSRRRFLGRVGAGAVVAGAGLSAAGSDVHGSQDAAAQGFTRMFALPPFAEPTQELTEALVAVGARGGPMDAKDDLSLGAESLFLERYISTDDNGYRFSGDKDNPSNPISVAGTTFVAQFLAHDITFDATSPLGHATDVSRSMNARSPVLDLESIYGGGPAISPQLYQADNRAKLRLERVGTYDDVPRLANGIAVMSDPRNDQTTILCGLHAAFLRFHNQMVDELGGGLGETAAFERARRETRWHYQWLIVNEFLPHVAGDAVVRDVLQHGHRYYTPRRASIPVEFAAAAFRFGHSMVRPSYRLNFEGNAGKPFFAMIFDPREAGKADPDDLRGGVRSARRYVDWRSFFDFDDDVVGPAKRIDAKISTPLFELPLSAIPVQQPPTSLVQRDLLRQVTWQLPSGQAVARAMGIDPLARADLEDLAPFGLGLDRSTPLWYYVLREASRVEQGLQLGPVGGRIVAEVVLGLVELDPASYVRAAPRWRPGIRGNDFRMVDLLRAAGVERTTPVA